MELFIATREKGMATVEAVLTTAEYTPRPCTPTTLAIIKLITNPAPRIAKLANNVQNLGVFILFIIILYIHSILELLAA